LEAGAQKGFAEASRLRRLGTKKALRESIVRYEESLDAYRLLGEEIRQADALHYIGLSHHFLGDSRQELDCNLRALELVRAKGDRSRDGLMLDELGSECIDGDEYEKGRDYFIQALEARRDAGDRLWEAITLKHIGMISMDMGDYQRAFDNINDALSL